MKKILMLNGELGSQMQIYLALCDAYNVEIAEDIRATMYLLRRTKPELLVLDYNFGQFRSNGKTGIDFIRKIKRKYHDLKVMTILETKDKVVENEIQLYGADEILYRPINDSSLLANVNKLAPALA